MISWLRTALRLGRVSNLPTVWTNVLAGMALAGAPFSIGVFIPVAAAASLFYTGGMYLNDAFDHRWDLAHRPERPIPSGHAALPVVFVAGFGFLVAALALLAVATPASPNTLTAGIVLSGLVVLYDVSHKKNPLAPVLMGLCRVCLYVIAAFSVTDQPHGAVIAGGTLLLAYLVALTVIARKETLNARIPNLVSRLIAGISLLDAALILTTGNVGLAIAATAGYPLTRALQRRVPGT